MKYSPKIKVWFHRIALVIGGITVFMVLSSLVGEGVPPALSSKNVEIIVTVISGVLVSIPAYRLNKRSGLVILKLKPQASAEREQNFWEIALAGVLTTCMTPIGLFIVLPITDERLGLSKPFSFFLCVMAVYFITWIFVAIFRKMTQSRTNELPHQGIAS